MYCAVGKTNFVSSVRRGAQLPELVLPNDVQHFLWAVMVSRMNSLKAEITLLRDPSASDKRLHFADYRLMTLRWIVDMFHGTNSLSPPDPALVIRAKSLIKERDALRSTALSLRAIKTE